MGGLLTMTRETAMESRPSGVTVENVTPEAIRTNMMDDLRPCIGNLARQTPIAYRLFGSTQVRGSGLGESLVEGLDETRVIALAGETQGLDALDENLRRRGRRSEQLHRLGDVILERHGMRVGSLVGAGEFRLHVGRGQFDDFDFRIAELEAQGLGVGVERGLRCAVGREQGERDEGEPGGDGHDRRVSLAEQVRQEGGGQTDRAEEVRGDLGFSVAQGGGRIVQVLRAHDAGVVDDDVEGGELGGELGRERADSGGILDVEDESGYAGIGADDFLKHGRTAARNDDAVAAGVEGLGEGAADTGAASGD